MQISIGELIESSAEYKGVELLDNREIDVCDLGIYVPTPMGQSLVKYVIKKENLQGTMLTLETGVEIKCASKHLLRQFGNDIFADLLMIGDTIETANGDVKIVDITKITDTTFYDIGIDSPHLYYDSGGTLHHNTLITAVLSHSCEEHGRTIVIVPNKSLVTQTEADYINMGLDVGVYFGDRKEFGRTHTICTWQSLNILLKGSRNHEVDITITEFLEDVVCVMVDECFDGNTLITTPKGKKPIKDLKPGDKVINLCEKSKQYKEDTVVKIHKNLTQSASEKMLELDFDNGIKTRVTANHKFLTNKGWVRADELTEDLEIINIDTYN